MRKIVLLVIIIFGVFITLKPSFSSSYIYDEERDFILFGGYPIEGLGYWMDEKEKFNLKNKIYVLNIKNGTVNLLIKSNNPITDYDISNKGYIAISIRIKEKSGKHDNIIIYDKNGQIKKILNDIPIRRDIRYFSWSKNGSKIAYITGKTIIEGHYPFEPTGIWIYDVDNDKAVKIADKGVKANWSRHDNNIYIENNFKDPTDISVYNTSTGKLTKSERKGIVFSDDGKYYIGTEVKHDPFPLESHFIYNNITNKKTYKFKEKDGAQLEMLSNAKFINNRHYLLMWGRVSYKIFDAVTKTTIRRSRGGLIGWNKDMTKGVVYEGGGEFIHIDLLMTGKRLKSIKIPEKEH